MGQLIETIERVKTKARKHRNYYMKNEEAVKQQLVLEILEELGWNIKNPEEVRPEDKTGMGRADYALVIDRKVVSYVEVKKLSIDVLKDTEPLKQLGKYCYDQGVNYGVLTNGVQWRVMKSFESGKTLEERILFSIDLEKDSVHKSTFLLSLLTKDRIQKLEEMSRIFKQLEDSFIALKNSGFSEEQIFKMLSGREELPEPSGNPPDSSVRISELKNVSNTKPVKAFVRLGSEWKELTLLKRTWRELLRQYAGFVLNNKGQLPIIQGYIVTKKSELKQWDRGSGEKSFIQVGSYYLYIWLSATDILRILRRIQDSTKIELAIVLEKKK
ncbi:type I restriction enzyme HsdR N-terminal domain-containing protein [Thermococcus sp.]